MKQILCMFAAVMFLSASASVQAQEQSTDKIVVINIQKMAFPEGSRASERDSLMELYHEHVTKKNPHILSQRVAQHLYGRDNRDMIIITEYKDWASIDVASKKDTELFEAHWKDREARREFNRMLGKYFAGHSDEIYTEKSKLRK